MEPPSGLEVFLQQQQSGGRVESEGHFTLAREKALQKLANYSLPFAGAWAVRVIQSLISSGATTSIVLSQSVRVTSITCQVTPSWTLDDAESAFFDPEPGDNRSLNHLISGLWMVGVSQQRGFQISFPGVADSLIWDGAKIHRSNRQVPDGFELVVTHQQPSNQSSWFLNPVAAGRENSDVLLALRQRCYTVPLPLSVDGLRIDGLQHCPGHGWSKNHFPLALAFSEGPLPNLTWPPGTFDAVGKGGNNELSDGGGLEGVTRAALTDIAEVERSASATLVTVHIEDYAAGAAVFVLRKRPSVCYWIQDGAQIYEEPYRLKPTCCSVGCFVSADGLPTDLTGLQLLDTPDRQFRKNQAGVLAQTAIDHLVRIDPSAAAEHNRSRYSKLGNVCLVLALGTGWYIPPIGLMIAVPLGIFGLFSRFATRAGLSELLKEVGSALRTLAELWEKESKSMERSARRLQKESQGTEL